MAEWPNRQECSPDDEIFINLAKHTTVVGLWSIVADDEDVTLADREFVEIEHPASLLEIAVRQRDRIEVWLSDLLVVDVHVAVDDLDGVSRQCDDSLDQIVVSDRLPVGRNPIEDDDIPTPDPVESVRELVDEHPVVLEQGGLHARPGDVELLQHEASDGQRDHERGDDDDQPLTDDLERR